MRQDFRPDGEDTTHLVLGLQGLAPHWWEVDAAAFLSTDGDLTARVEAAGYSDIRVTGRGPRHLEVAARGTDGRERQLHVGFDGQVRKRPAPGLPPL